jgi:hypothetical protein
MNDFIYNYIISTENEKIDKENCDADQDVMNRYEELVFNVPSEIEKQIDKTNESLSK